MFDPSIIHMAIASVFFFCMGLCVKALEQIHVSQIVFFRALVALIICLIQLRLVKVSPWGNKRKLLIARGVFGTFALIFFFTTLHYMPISTALVVQYLAPIFVSVLSIFLLKQSVRPIQWLFLTLAFTGIILIKGFSINIDPLILTMGIVSALCSGFAYICISKIKESEHPLVIIFYFPVITIPLILPFAIVNWTAPNLKEWILLILVGVFVQTAQYFMTIAYQRGNINQVSIVSYLGAVYAILADILYFKTTFNAGTILGMLFILIGVIGNSLKNKGPSKDGPQKIATE